MYQGVLRYLILEYNMLWLSIRRLYYVMCCLSTCNIISCSALSYCIMSYRMVFYNNILNYTSWDLILHYIAQHVIICVSTTFHYVFIIFVRSSNILNYSIWHSIIQTYSVFDSIIYNAMHCIFLSGNTNRRQAARNPQIVTGATNKTARTPAARVAWGINRTSDKQQEPTTCWSSTETQ